MSVAYPHLTRRSLLGRTAALAMGGVTVAQAEEATDVARMIHWPTMDLVGGATLHTKDWMGVAAIVVFWATWCPYCKRHNARINRLFHSLGNPGIRILGVAMGDTDTQVKAYMRANALDFPVTVGTSELKMQFSNRKTIPLTGLVRADGRLLQLIPGELAEDDILLLPSLIAG